MHSDFWQSCDTVQNINLKEYKNFSIKNYLEFKQDGIKHFAPCKVVLCTFHTHTHTYTHKAGYMAIMSAAAQRVAG